MLRPQPPFRRIAFSVGALALCLAGAGARLYWNADSSIRRRAERSSMPALEQEVKTHPDAPWPAYVLGTRYAEEGRLEPAMDLFDRVRMLVPNDFRPHASLGLGFLRLGALAPAQKHLTRAIELAPKEPLPHLYLGMTLRSLGRVRDAEAEGEAATRLAPRNAEAWYQLGVSCYQPNGRQGEGIEAWKRAVALDPSRARYQREYAGALADNGEYAAAEAHARSATELDPADAQSRYLLGKILHRGDPLGKQRDGAIRELREALRLGPELQAAHYELGVTLEEGNELSAARSELLACTRQAPRYSAGWFHLAAVETRLGHAAAATAARARYADLTRFEAEGQYLQRRILENPNDPGLQVQLGGLLEREGLWQAAVRQYQAILQRVPHQLQARKALDRLQREHPAARPQSPQP